MIQKDLLPWREIFLELAVRALRRLNYEFAPWTMGQSLHVNVTDNLGMINSSDGLKYVLETEVCSAITLEFLHSGFTNGDWTFNHIRRYAVDREIEINKKHIDLFVNRYEINDKGEKKYSADPVLIEAKRGRYFIPDLKEGKSRGSNNYSSIKRDIDKLRRARTFIEKKGKILGYDEYDFNGAFIYVMFWETTTTPKETKAQIMKKLECRDAENCNIRFFPTKWDQAGPEITEWGWVCLYEIEPPKDPIVKMKPMKSKVRVLKKRRI
jgi:hypothetical protein